MVTEQDGNGTVLKSMWYLLFLKNILKQMISNWNLKEPEN